MTIQFLNYLQIIKKVVVELVNFISAKNGMKNDTLFQQYIFFPTLLIISVWMYCQTKPSSNCLHTVFSIILNKLYAETECVKKITCWNCYHFMGYTYILTHKTSRNDCIKGCFHSLTPPVQKNHSPLFKKVFLHLGREVGMLHCCSHSERTLRLLLSTCFNLTNATFC